MRGESTQRLMQIPEEFLDRLHHLRIGLPGDNSLQPLTLGSAHRLHGCCRIKDMEAIFIHDIVGWSVILVCTEMQR